MFSTFLVFSTISSSVKTSSIFSEAATVFLSRPISSFRYNFNSKPLSAKEAIYLPDKEKQGDIYTHTQYKVGEGTEEA